MDTSGEKVKGKIKNILKKHPEGLTIQELSKKVKAHRQTVTKYVLELKGAGLIRRRRVGSATLHYLKGRNTMSFWKRLGGKSSVKLSLLILIVLGLIVGMVVL